MGPGPPELSGLASLGPALQIALIDLLLSGDNAVLIALACRSLHPSLVRRVVVLGTAAAIGLRVALTGGAALVLGVPLVRVFGAGLLLAIALRLLTEETVDDSGPEPAPSRRGAWKAIATIIAADTVMSLDNVLAVAAAARGSLPLLALGLVLSIPILVSGSALVYRLLKRFPVIVWFGAAQLGWISGSTALADPALQDWAQHQRVNYSWVAPITCAAYVLLHGAVVRRLSRRRRR